MLEAQQFMLHELGLSKGCDSCLRHALANLLSCLMSDLSTTEE